MKGRPALLLLPFLLITSFVFAQDAAKLQKLLRDLQSQSWNDQVKAAQALGEMAPARRR